MCLRWWRELFADYGCLLRLPFTSFRQETLRQRQSIYAQR